MTIDSTSFTPVGVQGIADALRSRLQRYIEAAYHLRDASVVRERRALLSAPGEIAREAFLETTPSYELGRRYGELGLPHPIGQTLDELAGWQPGIGVFLRPYRHQAEALEAFFNHRHDLIVSTGTGSGKTETFLLPIMGSLLAEASDRPASFRQPGFRALLLYPMNALVSDQIARLRRLFGDERLSELFRLRYGRHPRFGMYTSRTPYPGSRNPRRDNQNLDPILRYYVDLEAAAQRDGPRSQSAQLVEELRARGRWPAKSLDRFYGTPGGRWDRRLITQPGDRELLTRHEMQLDCPDILITNYSMLEYMLMRPIERSIFEQTRAWLASDPANSVILVVDEAHLYRGTAGAEVAYLIRRLQARLEIPRSRMRCIITSASLGSDETIEGDAIAFAEALTGSPAGGGRAFQLVRGYPEPRPPTRPGTPSEAAGLAAFDQAAFARRAEAPAAAVAAVSAVVEALGWPSPPEADGGDPAGGLRDYLYAQLHGMGPTELLIAQSTGSATSLADLADALFPEARADVARRATETLLELGTYAHNGQRPLLQARVHMLFRGLPSLWACVDPTCSARLDSGGEPGLLGRLYTEPRTHCECGARVYELLAHRDCGALFLRAFGEGDRASFYWHEAGGRVDPTAQQLQESWLVIERPLRKHEEAGLVEPIWMDTATGRIEANPPANLASYRQLWRPTPAARGQSSDDDDESVAAHTPFVKCPVCDKRSADKVLDLATRGERPFANLVHEQFVTQPPSRPLSEMLPNGGRKVLLFSDGRQKAARLARDLPREVEFDTFRQALALAVHRLRLIRSEPILGARLYAAFVAVCHDLRLHFFDQEFDSQRELLSHMRDFAKYNDADLDLALGEEDRIPDLPMSYRQHLLDQVANPFYSVYRLATMVIQPSRSSIRRLQHDLATLPEIVRTQIEVIASFWAQVLLDRGAFDKSIPSQIRERVSAYARPPKTGAAFKDLEKIIREAAGLNDSQIKQLRDALYAAMTDQDEQGLAYLKSSALALSLAFDEPWLRCATCRNLQHAPLLGRCAVCGGQQLEPRGPDDPAISARYDYYRAPLRAILRGERPAHLSAEEHTAQLSQRDRAAVYATTEEFELRFQDIALGEDRPPVDVLSCTTTMEVGIDIGSLVAIGMRNIPPQRENYQQRAGRAGRRGAAVSTVVAYADSGPHDHFYFHHPEGMIAGAPRRPLLSIDRQTLVRRHIYAYLIQTFFHEQLRALAPAELAELERERGSLFTALGTRSEFFAERGSISLATFSAWVDARVAAPGGDVAASAADWIPDAAVPGGRAARVRFVAEAACALIGRLQALGAGGQRQGEGASDQDDVEDRGGLLNALFDDGLLPSYAFPTDLASFYVFARDGDKVITKERPQQSKTQALSEYAPGRLLVVNKKTYRVGGIYVERNGYDAPARVLFDQPLPTYTYCPACTYVRLEPPRGIERCPVCQSELKTSELLDPPGFSPEKGEPVGERDREQEFSYAADAQLPLPISPDDLDWREGAWPNLRYAYAEGRQFIIMNRGPREEGFAVCESCGAAWPSADAPRGGAHSQPYLVPPRIRRSQCRGPIHSTPIYLGTTFRSDLLLLRCSLAGPLGDRPRDPWLQDALRTAAEALALAASRVLDVDPAELSAGHRLLPADSGASFDLYLFDTASGGAGYAAEAGAELGTILQAALDLVEGCPRDCERSCTRCLRHYGNRFWHVSLDRHLAAQVLRHIMYGAAPEVAPVTEQRRQLVALRRFLELEGWEIAPDSAGAPLVAGWGGRQVVVGTYPALLDPQDQGFSHPLGAGALLLRDYVVARDLPAAFAELRRAVGR